MIMKKYELHISAREQVVNKISSYLNEEHEEIAAAYVFGSFNTAEPFCDIDLAIIVQRDVVNPAAFEIDLESRLEKIVKYRVDVRIINRAPLAFCHDVIRDGRVIVDKDANLRADFQGKILKQYFDFAPFRRRYLNEVVNAPV
jgi:predicted nucleotidyltransferase